MVRVRAHSPPVRLSEGACEKDEAAPYLAWFVDGALELELEEAEQHLQSRYEKKQTFIQKQLEITEKKRRKWLMKQGKEHMLGFKDQ